GWGRVAPALAHWRSFWTRPPLRACVSGRESPLGWDALSLWRRAWLSVPRPRPRRSKTPGVLPSKTLIPRVARRRRRSPSLVRCGRRDQVADLLEQIAVLILLALGVVQELAPDRGVGREVLAGGLAKRFVGPVAQTGIVVLLQPRQQGFGGL